MSEVYIDGLPFPAEERPQVEKFIFHSFNVRYYFLFLHQFHISLVEFLFHQKKENKNNENKNKFACSEPWFGSLQDLAANLLAVVTM